MLAIAGRDLIAIGFLALVLALVLFQIIGGLRTGVIHMPGKERVFRVARATNPWSFWAGIVFYGFIIYVLQLLAQGVIREIVSPGPSEPTRLTAVAVDGSTVELSWLSPDRRDRPPSYGIYRSSEPGTALSEYQLIDTATNSPYRDRSVDTGRRYYYRVTSNYAGQPPAMSNEDSTTVR